jgi:hypothetical protein
MWIGSDTWILNDDVINLNMSLEGFSEKPVPLYKNTPSNTDSPLWRL